MPPDGIAIAEAGNFVTEKLDENNGLKRVGLRNATGINDETGAILLAYSSAKTTSIVDCISYLYANAGFRNSRLWTGMESMRTGELNPFP